MPLSCAQMLCIASCVVSLTDGLDRAYNSVNGKKIY